MLLFSVKKPNYSAPGLPRRHQNFRQAGAVSTHPRRVLMIRAFAALSRWAEQSRAFAERHSTCNFAPFILQLVAPGDANGRMG